MATNFDPGSGLGPRLRLVRESRGVSVRELARRVGCSASLISQVERGLSVPSVGVLYSLASELDCSLDFLLFGTGAEAATLGVGVEAAAVGGRAEAATLGAGAAVGTGAAEAATLGAGVPVVAASALAAVDAFRGEVPVLTRSAAASSRSDGTAARSDGTSPRSDGTSARSEGIVQRGCDRRIIDLASGVRWERLTPAGDDRTDFLEVIYSPGGHSTDERRPLRHEGREYGLILSGTLRANVGFETYELSEGDSIVFDSSTPHEYWNTTDDYVHAVWVVVRP